MEEEARTDRPAFDWTQSTFNKFGPTNNQNKSLVYIQREQHQKKLRGMKPPEPIEKLYQLDATRRQVLEVLKDEEHVRVTVPQCSWHPEIDKNSEKMAERLEPEVVNRVYNWQENKEKKMSEMSQKQREADEKRLQESTEKFRFVTGKFEVDSKVKNFVDSLDHRKATRTSKMIYQSNPPGVNSNDPHKSSPQFPSITQYQSQPVDGVPTQPFKKGFGSSTKVQGSRPPEISFRKQSKPLEPNQTKGTTKETIKNMVKDI
jgi:hypothetical protein